MPARFTLVASLLLAGAVRGQPAAPEAAPAPQPSPQETAAPPRGERPQIYDESADAREQIAAALKLAKKENRRVLIQWGANWCGWCHLLHDKFAKDAKIAKTLRYEYDVVLVDIGRWSKHMDLAKEYGADLRGSGVPYLTVLDADGRPLANQETGSLEAEGETPGHDAAKVLKFLTEHQAPPLEAAKVLEAGLGEAKAADKRVLLHFGAPWCVWCHKLEAWMATPEIAAVLAKDYVDVKIDVDRMTGGKEVLARFGGAGKGIPWMAVLDPSGEALISSDGPEGNTGFPVAPAEIEHFVAMLRKTSEKLTAADFRAIEASLMQPPAE